MHILLAGNPNCGKTTLFNALTGDNQRIGNWSGVTVEKKTGQFTLDQHTFDITDLPGVYSLSALSIEANQDERIAAEAIVSLPSDLIINVVDACHLERHLYLSSQLMELGKPMIVVLNMMDIALQRGIHIDTKQLAKCLKSPVIAVQAHKKIGIPLLQQTLLTQLEPTSSLELILPSDLQKNITDYQQYLMHEKDMTPIVAHYYALRIFEGDCSLLGANPLQAWKHDCLIADADIVLADARYQQIHQIVEAVQQKRSDASEHFTAKVDKIVLHRFWAFPIFFAMMYLMFLFAINIGGAFQDFFDISTNTIFVQGSAWVLNQIHAPQWSVAIIANGIGVGINTTLTFIPVIASMFFFLALLEASGYMARAAFVVDKAMRAMGLPGKSFVPMIVGFGCNVPAIMAARTLDSERDRLLTIIMSPFMSCSARLAIYAVFVAAFFPTGGQNVVFALYMIGILLAVLTGLMLRKTMLKGQSSPLILELPAYHKPSLKRLVRETNLRLRFFIFRAGRLIIPVCILLGGLNALTVTGSVSASEASTQSILSLLGQWLTPFFAPMGLTPDNWPATVGLLTGMLAKEVVVGSLNSLYAQLGHIGQIQAESFHFLASMKEALWSIPQNLAQLGDALMNPILASAPDGEVSKAVYGMMVSRFDGKIGAFSYLLFVLLYIPCVSTMAVIRQEASKRFMWFSITWSFLIAYAAAVLFYQVATIARHPTQSLFWILLMMGLIAAFVSFLRWKGVKTGGQYVIANS